MLNFWSNDDNWVLQRSYDLNENQSDIECHFFVELLSHGTNYFYKGLSDNNQT